MAWYLGVILFMSLLITICCLAQANKGTASGIGALTGSDIELFQQQKDRGFSRFLFFFTMVLAIVFVIFCLVIVMAYGKTW